MSNITIPNKSPGDQHTAAEVNQQTGWTNSPMQSLGAFNPAMVFDSQGQYNNYTLTGDTIITASSIVLFNMQVVRITTDGTHNLTFSTGIDKLITQFTNPLPSGNYWLYMASFIGPDESTPGVHISIPDVLNVPIITQLTTPTLNTATPGNTEVTLAFTNPNSGNEDDNLIQYKLDTEPTTWTDGVVLATDAVSGIQTGLTNDLLYNFRIIARGSGSYSNSAPSNELSSTPTLVIITEMQDDFAGTTIDTSKWTVTNPNVATLPITQNDMAIWTEDGVTTIGATENNLRSKLEITRAVMSFQADLNRTSAVLANTPLMSLIDASNTYHISIQPQGTGAPKTNARIYINGNTVYDTGTTSVALDNTWKIEMDADGTVRVYYLSAPDTWTQVGTTQSAIMPDLDYSCRLASGSTNQDDAGDETQFDNVYFYPTHYSTSTP